MFQELAINFRATLFVATLVIGTGSPNIATACQLAITGAQTAINSSATIDCIIVVNANVAGDINNTGSIVQNGITISNSTVNGAISNTGSLAGGNASSLAGGIAADEKSVISGGVVGIGLIGIPVVSGGISTKATINAGSGIYVDGVPTFAGGIANAGQIPRETDFPSATFRVFPEE
jgi:hypothetical protein